MSSRPANLLINGYSHNGPHCSLSVMELFKSMLSDESAPLPNSYTFAGVFTAVGAAADGHGGGFGRGVHSVAIKTASCDDVFVGSSLLAMYCKMGLVSDARRVFDRMPHRNSVSWAAMVSGYAVDKSGLEAFGLFKDLIDRGDCNPNEFVYTGALSALCRPEFLEMGRQIHGLVVKDGFLSFASIQNSLITLYAKCESLHDAISMFHSTSGGNSITWSAMITAYAQNGEPGEALVTFLQMLSHGFKPSEYTFVGVLNACSDANALTEGRQLHGFLVKTGLELQLFIKSALVDMYSKCGNIEDAKKGFDQFHFHEADVVLLTTMVGGHVQNGEQEEALALYARLEREGMLPNHLTMASVLRACSGLAALDQGKQIHARILKHGFSLGVPVGSALSTMYAKCGDLDDCSRVFRRMSERDVVAWNSIISGFSQNGHGKVALNLFEEMKSEGIEPDRVTFVNVLSACSHMGMVERGWGYFRSMQEVHGIVPTVEHYSCMVDILSRAGMLEEAKDFIQSIAVDHGIFLWRIVLGACRNHRSCFGVGAYAGERLMELGTTDSSAYILLSNIYAASNRWDDVERVRRVMRLRGVNKDPGCSWLEINSRVHVFVVGEQLHPEIKNVYAEVRRLVKNMKDEGYRPASGLTLLSDSSEQYVGSYHEQGSLLIASAA